MTGLEIPDLRWFVTDEIYERAGLRVIVLDWVGIRGKVLIFEIISGRQKIWGFWQGVEVL